MFVYVLRSEKDGSLYVGSTKDIKERVISHNNGYNSATKTKRPWVLIRTEEYNNISLAFKREKFLKSGDGRKVLEHLCSFNKV